MSRLPLEERRAWEERWHGTIWEGLDGGGWLELPTTSPGPQVVISAWNPLGMRLPQPVNRARDALLMGELQARGLSARRARGRSPDGAWWEDGWQIAHEADRTQLLVRRYGQLAGWVTDAGGARFHWADET